MCINYFSGVDHGTSDQGASAFTSNRLSSTPYEVMTFVPSTAKICSRVVTQDGYFQTGNAIYRVPVLKLNFRWEGVIFFYKEHPYYYESFKVELLFSAVRRHPQV